MKQYKQWFAFVVTFMLVLAVFFICDCIFAGLVYALCLLLWGNSVAVIVFKWIVFVFISAQALFTLPFALKAVDKD